MRKKTKIYRGGAGEKPKKKTGSKNRLRKAWHRLISTSPFPTKKTVSTNQTKTPVGPDVPKAKTPKKETKNKAPPPTTTEPTKSPLASSQKTQTAAQTAEQTAAKTAQSTTPQLSPTPGDGSDPKTKKVETPAKTLGTEEKKSKSVEDNIKEAQLEKLARASFDLKRAQNATEIQEYKTKLMEESKTKTENGKILVNHEKIEAMVKEKYPDFETVRDKYIHKQRKEQEANQKRNAVYDALRVSSA